ncbi:MAG: hypothetical protein H6492_00700 [Candidatus Paracaedibacteraceae bacterium]|nr:hypothetical protein [Candidatus Paracaedibacteraceae bacterium]
MNKTALILTFLLGISINDASSLLDAGAAAKDPAPFLHADSGSGSGYHAVYMRDDTSASSTSSSGGMDCSSASPIDSSDNEDVDMEGFRRSRSPSPEWGFGFRADAVADADLLAVAEEVEEELGLAARAAVEEVEVRPVYRHALGPAPAGNPGIVGVFVPPVVPVDPAVILRKNLRAAAHRDAFPFAPFHWHFLANIQRAWLRYWLAAYGTAERYPLARAIPSFGWTEQMRLEDRNEPCQMCGRDRLTVVVIMHNPRSPLGKRILRVGVDCATFMKLTQAHVYQIAWANEDPLP